MSAGAAAKKTVGTRLVQAVLLAFFFAMLYVTTRTVPEIHGGAGTIAAVGFLLLAGTLAGELFEVIGVPHLTAYLAAGIVSGPYVLHLIDEASVERLQSINALALSLIAMAGGAELRLSILRKGLGSLGWALLMQSVLLLVVMTAVFLVARRFIPFLEGVPLPAVVGLGLCWGVLAMTRSPSATLGILSQTRARGPIAHYTLTFVMASDPVIVVLLASALTLARPLVNQGESLSLGAFRALGYEILGSVALGTTLGLVLAAYMRLVGRQLVVVFLALGFGLTEVLGFLRFDATLTFMVAGFVVMNLTKQGEKFLHAIEQTGDIVYVIFFAIAGAHLNLPLLKQLWQAAALLFVARAVTTVFASRLASRVANDVDSVRKAGWSGLISQAGLALVLSGVVAREFPQFGDGLRNLAIATVALNEVIGPILFKLALDRAGETSRAPQATIPSIRPPPPPPPEESADESDAQVEA